MNLVMVVLTLAVLAGTLVSCAVLGADRFGPLQRLSEDGLAAPGPARGPLEQEDGSPEGAARADTGTGAGEGSGAGAGREAGGSWS